MRCPIPGLLILFFLSCFNNASAQVKLYSSQQTAIYNQLDSTFKSTLAARPDTPVLAALASAYRSVTHSTNPVIPAIDSESQRTRMAPPDIFSTIIRMYLFHGLFPAVRGADSGFSSIKPVADHYNRAVCSCIGQASPDWAKADLGKLMAGRLDSCKNAFNTSNDYRRYRQLTDSAGLKAMRAHSTNEDVAYFIQSCRTFQLAIANGLAGLEEHTPREQQLVRLNAFHNTMYDAIAGNKPALAKKHASSTDLSILQKHLAAIQKNFGNKLPVIRMAFYNETAMFYFLTEGKVHSRLSYPFSYTGSEYRLSTPKYELRKDLGEKISDDQYIANHFFRHPLPVFDYNGFPRGELLLQYQKITRAPVIEQLKNVDLRPF